MNKYGECTIEAVQLVNSGQASSPVDAWHQATSALFGAGTPGQVKGCPRGAFLGLCGEGLIRGIPPGDYTRSVRNSRYAVRVVSCLRTDPSFAERPDDLWQVVVDGVPKQHNSQIDVVLALWEAGLLVDQHVDAGVEPFADGASD